MKEIFKDQSHKQVTEEILNPTFKNWKKSWKGISLDMGKNTDLKDLYNRYVRDSKKYSLSGMTKEVGDIYYLCFIVELEENTTKLNLKLISIGEKEFDFLSENYIHIGSMGYQHKLPAFISNKTKEAEIEKLRSVYS